MRASQCPMAGLPVEAGEALIMLAMSLVVSNMIAGQAKRFVGFRYWVGRW